MSRVPKAPGPPLGRTMKAAFVRPQEVGEGEGVVKAGELVDATYPDGASLSGAARKVLVLLLAKAAGDAWKDAEFSISKGDLRGSHRSNDRLDKVLDELQRTLLRVRVKSPRGNDAVLVAPVVAQRIEEMSDDATSLVYWRFSEPMRRIMQASDHYAELQKQAVLAFDSRYAVTLYEQGCLRYRRQHPVWQGSVKDLREMLGVPSGKMVAWSDLRRFALEAAKAEIDHLAPFTVHWTEQRRGRAVVAIEIRFEPKSLDARANAAAELERSRVGRKARRQGTVETVASISPAVAADLQKLRKGG